MINENIKIIKDQKIGKQKLAYQDLVNQIEKKHLHAALESEKAHIHAGDIIRLGYKILEGNKERVQYCEGVVIAKQNRTISKTFKIRRMVQGIGVEQTFFENSPKIVSIKKKQSSKVRRAKLYFLRGLKGKAARLKERP